MARGRHEPFAVAGRRRAVAAWLAALAFVALAAFAGTSRAADDGGPTITEIKIVGNESIKVEQVRGKMLSKVGRAYDQATIDADQRSLSKAKWFSNVRILRQDNPDGKGVTLVVEVVEMPTLTSVEFRGRKALSLKTIEDHTDLKVGSRADHVKNRAAVGSIRRLYVEKGYELAEVALLEGGNPGDRKVVYEIFEGPKVRIRNIKFTGNSDVASDALLHTKITSKTALFSWLRTQPPRDGIEEDVRKLTEYYQSLGYFDATVSPSVRTLNDPGELELEFVISEGIQYSVREIKFKGNEKLTEEQLLQGMQLRGGKPYNDAMRTGDAKTLQQKYTALGCIDVAIVPEPKFTETPGVVDLIYQIDEGDRYLIGAINVHGNGRTRDKVIRREMLMAGLAPDEPLDGVKIDNARKRLQNLQYFNNMPDNNKPLTITVTNRRPAEQRFPSIAAPDLNEVIRTRFYGPEPQPRASLTETAYQDPADDPPPIPPQVPPVEPLAPGSGPAAVPFGSGGVFNPAPGAVPVIPVPAAPPDGMPPVVPLPPGRRPGSREGGDGFPSLPGENMSDVGPDRGDAFQNRNISSIASQVEPGAPRSYADLNADVEEGPTGRIALGAGFTSYGGVSGNFIFHERNFDLFNFPRSLRDMFSGQAFRGGGQELRIEASPGTLINRFMVSFREPYLFDLPIGLGVSGYAFARQYPSYMEKRGGGRFSLGRQIGTQVYADVAARVEDVDLSNFSFPRRPPTWRPRGIRSWPRSGRASGSTTGTTRCSPAGPTHRGGVRAGLGHLHVPQVHPGSPHPLPDHAAARPDRQADVHAPRLLRHRRAGHAHV
ncbi:MAG: POTRA domain-containing protein [Isosphaeraceae bacterium]